MQLRLYGDDCLEEVRRVPLPGGQSGPSPADSLAAGDIDSDGIVGDHVFFGGRSGYVRPAGLTAAGSAPVGAEETPVFAPPYIVSVGGGDVDVDRDHDIALGIALSHSRGSPAQTRPRPPMRV